MESAQNSTEKRMATRRTVHHKKKSTEPVKVVELNPESMEEITAEPAPLSTVPLADESGHVTASPAEIEQQKTIEEQIKERAEREPRIQKQVMEDVQPTRAMVKANMAAELGKIQAKEARERMSKTVTESKQQRLNKEFVDIANSEDSPLQQEMFECCRILNGYREAYQARLNYPFKPHYTPEMRGGRPFLLAERKNIETLLNTQDLPSIMKEVMGKMSELVEVIASRVFHLPLEGLYSDIELALRTGYFDAEIEQLSIEWSGWLAQPPGRRLMLKLLWIGTNRAMKNKGPISGVQGSQSSQDPAFLSEQIKKKASHDL